MTPFKNTPAILLVRYLLWYLSCRLIHQACADVAGRRFGAVAMLKTSCENRVLLSGYRHACRTFNLSLNLEDRGRIISQDSRKPSRAP